MQPDLEYMLSFVGLKKVNEIYVEKYQEKVKERFQIIEKNKKLESLKKPLEAVPIVDPLTKDQTDGCNYVYFNKNMKFINLMENNFTIDIIDLLKKTIGRAQDMMFSIERNVPEFENLSRLRTLNGHKILM